MIAEHLISWGLGSMFTFAYIGSRRDVEALVGIAMMLAIGMCLLSLRACLRIIGVMMIAGGIYVGVFRGAPEGVAFVVAGVALIVFVRKWQARVDEKKAEELVESAERWRPEPASDDEES